MNKTSNQIKICAVVVTYNRKDLLKDTLEGLKNQSRKLDAVYLVDNASTDGTPKELKKWGYINDLPPENLTEPWERHFKNSLGNFVYVRNNVNNGGSGGFYEGIKRAHQSKKYDWIWVMDDDVVPDKRALFEMLNALDLVKTDERISAVASLRFNKDGRFLNCDCKRINLTNPFKKLFMHPITYRDTQLDYLYIQSAPFEGIMVNYGIINAVGLPNKHFFIGGDDVEYCIRMSKVGKILLAPRSKIIRSLGDPESPKIQDWKYYYVVRNLLYIRYKHGTVFYKIVYFVLNFFRIIIGSLIILASRPLLLKKYLIANVKASIDSLLLFSQH